MFIRRTPTRRTPSGEAHHTYRLVESRREGDRVRQATLLNLGRHFDLAEEHWPGLCARLSQLLGSQGALVTLDLPEGVETTAQALAAQFVARTAAPTATAAEFVEVDIHSLELTQPRSVGVEHVGLHGPGAVGIRALAGFPGPQRHHPLHDPGPGGGAHGGASIGVGHLGLAQ